MTLVEGANDSRMHRFRLGGRGRDYFRTVLTDGRVRRSSGHSQTGAQRAFVWLGANDARVEKLDSGLMATPGLSKTYDGWGWSELAQAPPRPLGWQANGTIIEIFQNDLQNC